MRKIIIIVFLITLYGNTFADIISDNICLNYDKKCYDYCMYKKSNSPIYYGGKCKEECCNDTIYSIFSILVLILLVFIIGIIKIKKSKNNLDNKINNDK